MDTIYHANGQNVNELHNRTVRAAEYITTKKPANIWQETEYCLVCHDMVTMLKSNEHTGKFVRSRNQT